MVATSADFEGAYAEGGPGAVVSLARAHDCMADAIEWAFFSSELALMEALTVCGWLICGEDPEAFFEKHPLPQKERVCGVVWKPGSFAYRCLDCEQDSTCAICVECFKAGDHRGHNYRLIRTDGGCCDCGNQHAWREGGFCSKHRVEEEEGASPQLPAGVESGTRLVVRALARKLQAELPLALAATADAQRGRAAFGPEPAEALAPAAEPPSRLHRAVRRNKLLEVRSLLAAGADVNALDRSEFRTTALHWAAIHGNHRIVSELLDSGASVDAVNAFGQTALLCTVFEGHLHVAKLLLERRANPLARDHVFGPPLDVVTTERPRRHRKMLRLLRAFAPGGSFAPAAEAGGEAARSGARLPRPALSAQSRRLCALELCRVLLRWLCAIGSHGHSIKQLIATELCAAWAQGGPAPSGLSELIKLHVGCARTRKLEPLVELDELCFMCVAPWPAPRPRPSVPCPPLRASRIALARSRSHARALGARAGSAAPRRAGCWSCPRSRRRSPSTCCANTECSRARTQTCYRRRRLQRLLLRPTVRRERRARRGPPA